MLSKSIVLGSRSIAMQKATTIAIVVCLGLLGVWYISPTYTLPVSQDPKIPSKQASTWSPPAPLLPFSETSKRKLLGREKVVKTVQKGDERGTTKMKSQNSSGVGKDKGNEGNERVPWTITSYALLVLSFLCTCPCIFGLIYLAVTLVLHNISFSTLITAPSSSYKIVPQEESQKKEEVTAPSSYQQMVPQEEPQEKEEVTAPSSDQMVPQDESEEKGKEEAIVPSSYQQTVPQEESQEEDGKKKTKSKAKSRAKAKAGTRKKMTKAEARCPDCPAIFQIYASQAFLNKLALVLMLSLGLAFEENGKPPSWILAVVLVFVLQGRCVEYGLLKIFGGPLTLRDAGGFLMSALDSYDDCGDGLVLAGMILNNAFIQHSYVRTFELSSWGFVRAYAPIAQIVPLWGVAVIFLLISQMFQLSLVAVAEGTHLSAFDASQLQEGFKDFDSIDRHICDGKELHAVAAEAAGFSTLAARLERVHLFVAQELPMGFKVLALGFARGLLENAIQGIISTEFLMLMGVRSLLDQPMTLFSAVTSVLSLLYKGFEVLKFAATLRALELQRGVTSPVQRMAWVSGLCIFGIASLIAVKLYFIQFCPHHAWQISSGCIDLRN